jgi:hypothetical protein
MQDFAETWAARQPQLDAVFAETVRLAPMLPGGYGTAPEDPSRTPRELPAIITEKPMRRHAVENAIGGDFDRRFVVAETVASIDRARLGADLPKVGDVLIAIDRPDRPAFDITVVESDGLARVLLSLVRANP